MRLRLLPDHPVLERYIDAALTLDEIVDIYSTHAPADSYAQDQAALRTLGSTFELRTDEFLAAARELVAPKLTVMHPDPPRSDGGSELGQAE
jgi:hypothetical protein